MVQISLQFSFFNAVLFVYFWLVLGLRSCVGFSLVVVKGGQSLVFWSLEAIAVASLLQSSGSRALWLP